MMMKLLMIKSRIVAWQCRGCHIIQGDDKNNSNFLLTIT